MIEAGVFDPVVQKGRDPVARGDSVFAKKSSDLSGQLVKIAVGQTARVTDDSLARPVKQRAALEHTADDSRHALCGVPERTVARIEEGPHALFHKDFHQLALLRYVGADGECIGQPVLTHGGRKSHDVVGGPQTALGHLEGKGRGPLPVLPRSAN